MEAGKLETKKFFENQLSRRQQTQFIKRLNKLKQKDLLVFLS
jgi:hypothetical protein